MEKIASTVMPQGEGYIHIYTHIHACNYIMMNQENSSVHIKHVLTACAILLRCPHGAFDRQMIGGSSRAPLR